MKNNYNGLDESLNIESKIVEVEKIKEELIQHELIVDATEQAVLATFRAG
jgi:hypothetical protein